jgi:ADP-ribose 1''-phosphate phosphatase
VKNTAPAMQMLLELVKRADGEIGEIGEIGEVRMCKINSGKFGVPWKMTSDALEGFVVEEGRKGRVEVWEPSDKTE